MLETSPVTKDVAKVPVIMQMEAIECGAASLAMEMAGFRSSGCGPTAACPETAPTHATY